MFVELGMILDNLLNDIGKWNAQRFWYKIYAHFYIIRKIKANSFKDTIHFSRFMDSILNSNKIWGWQYIRMYELYYRSRGI